MPLTYWLLLAVLYFNFGLPPAVTGEFSERDRRQFNVASVNRAADPPTYARLSLAQYLEDGEAAATRDFRLPVASITISDGDIDTVRVLEDRGDWQLIEYLHNNTATTASVYRASSSGIEPVSLRVISNVGSGLILLALIIPAYALAWATVRYFRRPQESGAGSDEQSD